MLLIKTVSLEFVFVFLFMAVHCQDPPVIIGTIKPEYTVREGRTVKLWCKVSGTKGSVVNRTLTAWKKPTNVVITEKFPRFKMKMGRFLKITRVKLADQGTYYCIAYNPYGKIRRQIRLVVQASNSRVPTQTTISTTGLSPSPRFASRSTETPPKPSKLPLIAGRPPTFRNPKNRSSEYAAGSPIRLKCHADGEAPLNITWQKDGKRLDRSYRKFVKRDGWVLHFRHLSSKNAGTYSCLVKNTFGSSVKTFDIKVVDRVGDSNRFPPAAKPVILEGVLKNQTVAIGGNVTFACSARGRSYPKFHLLKWKSPKADSSNSDPFEFVDFRNPKYEEIRKAPKPHLGNRQVYTHYFLIRNVTLADEAKYTCVVGNSAGWVSAHAMLSVRQVEENGGSTERNRTELTWFTVTNAPSDAKARIEKLDEATVDEFPLPVLIGIPIAVLIVLIGTIVWCYFMTRKHYCTPHQFKQSSPQNEPNTDLSLQYYPSRRNETRNVSFNVYFDCPSETRGQSEQSSPRTAQDKLDSPLETDPPLDGLVVHQELPWIRSNRTNHRKRIEREGIELSESSGSETKCLKV